VELSINSLLKELDDFVFERSSAEYRLAAGLAGPRSLASLHAEHPRLTSAEVHHWVQELKESPRADETRRARLTLVQGFLTAAFVELQAAPGLDALDTHLRTHPFKAAGRQWTPAEALRELPRQASREARVALEGELSSALLAATSHWARATEAILASHTALGLPSPLAVLERAPGRSLNRVRARAQDALRLTEDAYRELLSHALKRVDSTLRVGHARLHDAQRAADAPWLSELLRREDLEHAVTRCLGDLGLDPNAHGRIVIDAKPHGGDGPLAQVFPMRIPDEIRLVLTTGGGFEPWAAWLSAWGQAQHRALVSRTTPFVERTLGDAAIPHAVGLLFESFLLDEAWLRRYVRLTSAQAVEVARMFAFRQTFQLRREAALVDVLAELISRGPGEGLQREFPERLQLALKAEIPNGRLVVDADARGDCLWRLDGWALEGLLAADLEQRFNEDYWRNPATGRWLANFALAGQREDSSAIAKALGQEAFPIAPAARRRIAVMGA
jgi:hypothetical protein